MFHEGSGEIKYSPLPSSVTISETNKPSSLIDFCLKIYWDTLSEDEIKDSLDGLAVNDESIDAFFVDENNKEINFLQCKSCESEKDIKTTKTWLNSLSTKNIISNRPEEGSYVWENITSGKVIELINEYEFSKEATCKNQ